MALLRYGLAAVVGAVVFVGTAYGVLSEWWVALVGGAAGIVLLPRQPRLVAAAVAGAAATTVTWSVLWSLSRQAL